ncbi:MAG: deoxyguanosinetriphosphate triphosphohydrolase [Syntrophorhabdaceae bacterium]|nr:deoxyguanosinetriphosphate triphosphohydrolase [Syntrophorhabdaceae bacterium]MDD4196662.1 deoxyguanosinetriphosphate triphosphohydrolase [Syntrophorhabdaceae bacterium]HOC45269.1 deoxyguanosinetriphosphate triphosphohydrolase [Syntrophorhabdaceae bacterium]
MNVRERLEEREDKIFSPYAQKSALTRGRMRYEPECDIRPAFQHDRDRITHSKSFRRLKYKTQVFLSPGDHYRTRMTHTLEVSQIARTIGRALSLNEDLVEAIALGHDLGHTPFGHSGEEVLNTLYPDGFRHYEQSLRVVDILEKDGQGLNLTQEVRDGIVKHSKGKGDILINDDHEKPLTREAEVVRIADIIAYINHDIDDAIRGSVICENDIPRHLTDHLGHTVSDRIDTMVRGVISNTLESGTMQIGCGEELESYMVEMRGFLYERVYESPVVHSAFIKCSKIIEDLYDFFLRNPDAFLKETGRDDFYDKPVTCVRDFIAGMTDRYAFSLFEKLFLPMPWSIPV